MVFNTNINLNKSFVYDLGREETIFRKLNNSIKDLERSQFETSFYDFYTRNGILYELKSFSKVIKSNYIWACMNQTKLKKYKHIVFLFEYENEDKNSTETHNLFYHIFDHKRIYPKGVINVRGKSVDIINIPMEELISFDFTLEYEFDFEDITNTDMDLFNKIIVDLDESVSTTRTDNTVLKWRDGKHKFLTDDIYRTLYSNKKPI